MSATDATTETGTTVLELDAVVASATLVPTTNSWYLGSIVRGKPRRLTPYLGGVGTYRQKCDEEAATGYPTFRMS